MKRYEVVQSLRWRNIATGATASIFGAAPYTSDADKGEWVVDGLGFTIKDNQTGRVGIGRLPFATKDEAQHFIDSRPAIFRQTEI